MNDLKEILIEIKTALLAINEELSRANDLKEIKLGIKDSATYRLESSIRKMRKKN